MPLPISKGEGLIFLLAPGATRRVMGLLKKVGEANALPL